MKVMRQWEKTLDGSSWPLARQTNEIQNDATPRGHFPIFFCFLRFFPFRSIFRGHVLELVSLSVK